MAYVSSYASLNKCLIAAPPSLFDDEHPAIFAALSIPIVSLISSAPLSLSRQRRVFRFVLHEAHFVFPPGIRPPSYAIL